MSDDRELLDLIFTAARGEIRLNHESAELYQDDAQRAIAAMATAKDLLQGDDTAMLMELVKNQKS